VRERSRPTNGQQYVELAGPRDGHDRQRSGRVVTAQRVQVGVLPSQPPHPAVPAETRGCARVLVEGQLPGELTTKAEARTNRVSDLSSTGIRSRSHRPRVHPVVQRRLVGEDASQFGGEDCVQPGGTVAGRPASTEPARPAVPAYRRTVPGAAANGSGPAAYPPPVAASSSERPVRRPPQPVRRATARHPARTAPAAVCGQVAQPAKGQPGDLVDIHPAESALPRGGTGTPSQFGAPPGVESGIRARHAELGS
jgi:hypothetical protein